MREIITVVKYLPMDLLWMIIRSEWRCEERGPLNQSWSDFRGTKMNTSRSLSVDRPEIRHASERLRLGLRPAAGERGSRVLEIQLIDERSLVRQTETGMWEEALDARAETGRRRRRRRRGRGEEGVAPGLARRVPSRIMYDRTRWSRVPENHEGPHNSRTPCRAACHTFRTALKSSKPARVPAWPECALLGRGLCGGTGGARGFIAAVSPGEREREREI